MSNLNPETRREFALRACREGGWHEVQADSVADYLTRYYRRDRKTETLLATYEQEFAAEGFVSTSHWDSVTGEHICWFGPVAK
jgi:hypothetical protein